MLRPIEWLGVPGGGTGTPKDLFEIAFASGHEVKDTLPAVLQGLVRGNENAPESTGVIDQTALRAANNDPVARTKSQSLLVAQTADHTHAMILGFARVGVRSGGIWRGDIIDVREVVAAPDAPGYIGPVLLGRCVALFKGLIDAPVELQYTQTAGLNPDILAGFGFERQTQEGPGRHRKRTQPAYKAAAASAVMHRMTKHPTGVVSIQTLYD